jgi:hypothetical protein
MSSKSKDTSAVANANDMKPGTRFHDGDVSFMIIGPDQKEEEILYVQCSVLSAGFTRTRPRIIPMRKARILELIDAELGLKVLNDGRLSTKGIGNIRPVVKKHEQNFTFRQYIPIMGTSC